MKINPFRKKTSGYFAKLQAEFATVCAEIEATEATLASARDDHAAKAEASRQLEDRHPGRVHISETEKVARLAANAAEQRVRDLERAQWKAKQRHNALRHRVEAPQQLARAQASMVDLGRQRQSLEADRDKAQALVAKIDTRVSELTEHIRFETDAASASLIEGDGEFVMPQALLRLDTELRVAHTTRADVQARVDALADELNKIPDALRAARTSFLHARATVAEIEVQEQLPAFIELIARAAVSGNECDVSTPDDRYEIEIAHDVLSTVRDRLAAEMPAG